MSPDVEISIALILRDVIDITQALLAVKSLGKSLSGSRVIAKQSNLITVLAVAKALDSDAEASSEAFRCVANALLLVEEARRTLVSKEVGGGQTMVLLLEVSPCNVMLRRRRQTLSVQRSTNAERIFLASRILFLASVSIFDATKFIVSLVETKYPEQNTSIVDIIAARLDSLTTSILSGEKLAREAMTDLLKFAFNILLHYPKVRHFLLRHELEGLLLFQIVDTSEADADTSEKAKGKEAESNKKVMGDCWSEKLDGYVLTQFTALEVANLILRQYPCTAFAPSEHTPSDLPCTTGCSLNPCYPRPHRHPRHSFSTSCLVPSSQ